MNALVAIFMNVTQVLSLPPGLLSAVCWVESNHRTRVVNYHDGGSESFGVCQIKINSARLVGFVGTQKDLRDPKVNVFYAGKFLKHQMDRYSGDIPKAVAAYNAGSYRLNKQGKVKNNYYVGKVLNAWVEGK